jgi:uncharacterized membrane protein
MATTIGNPLSWAARLISRASSDIGDAAQAIGGEDAAPPEVRHIGIADIRAALRAGIEDFAALRTDVMAICLLYPVIGACLVWFAVNRDFVHLVFPLVSGFALIGPAVAVGLYEMSRRRESGQKVGWADGFGVIGRPAFGAIVVLGLMLVGVFTLWMLAAWGIYLATLGTAPPTSVGSFVDTLLTTGAGWALIIVGFAVGFVFAALVLAISVVSFPLLVDRSVGLPVAVVTSVRVARESPVAVATWGLIVAVLLAAGSLPLLLGLAVVLPVLGHATWHLYRHAVV